MKKVCVAIIFLLIIGFLFVLAAAPFINDHMAKKTANELADLPLPECTELIIENR